MSDAVSAYALSTQPSARETAIATDVFWNAIPILLLNLAADSYFTNQRVSTLGALVVGIARSSSSVVLVVRLNHATSAGDCDASSPAVLCRAAVAVSTCPLRAARRPLRRGQRS